MDNEWGRAYRKGKQLAAWPWSDLVALVMRHVKPWPGCRVLELGPGTGANVPFFVALGCQYHGVEVSKTAMDMLQSSFPDGPTFIHADFTRALPLGQYDLVVDRASVTHNEPKAIRRCLGMVLRALRPGGWFVGVDWFSTADTHHGRFRGLGVVQRHDEAEMRTLFAGWDILHLEHVKRTHQQGDASGKVIATWNIVARVA